MPQNVNYSDADIANLQAYADQMQALGKSAPTQLQASQPPSDEDIQALRDYADAWEKAGKEAKKQGADETAQTFTEKKGGDKGGTKKPSETDDAIAASAAENNKADDSLPKAHAMLGFGLTDPMQYVGGPMTGNPAPTVKTQGADLGAIPEPKGKGFNMPPIDMTKPMTPPQSKGDFYANAQKALTGAGATITPRTDLSPQETAAGASGGAPVAQQSGPAVVPQALIPGKWMPNISPKSQQLENAAFGPEREDDLRNREIDARLFQQKAIEQAGERAGDAYAEQERARAERDRQQRIVERTQRQVDAANHAYETAKVDPNRFFKNQGTGGQIMSALGVALGAFGATLGHSQNFALEIVNKAIDRDIDAQKEELAKRGRVAGNMLAQLRDKTGSLQDAETAYRTAALQYTKTKLDELGAQGKDVDIQRQLSDELQKLAEVRAARNEAHEVYRPPMIVGGGGLSDKELGLTFKAPDGTVYKANNEESYKKLTEGATLYSGLRDDLADYQAALRDVGPSDRAAAKIGVSTDAMSRARTAYTNMMGKIRQGNDDGVWKKSETEMLENTVAPPDSFTGNPQTQIGAALKHADHLWDATLSTHNPRPVREGYKYNAKGQLEPTGSYTGGQTQQTPQTPSSFKKD